jgi:predicted DNA-binding protein (MmcQ/YjbR family)
MDLESIRAYCLSLPGTTEDVKWETTLCFCIGGKIFAMTGFSSSPIGISLKASEEEFVELCDRVGFRPAPYLARNNWVHVDDAGPLPANELQYLLNHSYELVVARLPKKVQQNLRGGGRQEGAEVEGD